MDLLKLIDENIQKRFEAESILNGYGKHISRTAMNQINEKYKDATFKKSGYTFKFYKSHCHIDFGYDDIRKYMVDCSLMFSVTAKLIGARKKALRQAQSKFYESGYTPYYEGERTLWQVLTYDVDIEDVINNEISLKVNDETI